MEHVLSLQDPPEQFDHSTDLGTGTVKAGMVGTREEDFARLYAWIDTELPSDGSGPFSSAGACGYNRPCAHQYVGKSQSCMVQNDRLILHA